MTESKKTDELQEVNSKLPEPQTHIRAADAHAINILKIVHKQAADADSQHFSVIALFPPTFRFHHPLLQQSPQHKHLQRCCHSAAEEVTRACT